MSIPKAASAPLAYSLPDAAVACGVSLSTLNRAIANGEVTRRYPNRKPVILATELEAWLESLPVDKPTPA